MKLPYVRRWGKRIADRLLDPLGLELRRQRGQVDRQRLFLHNWRSLGQQPALIIDVGANRGEWTRQTLRVFPDAAVIMVEPQDELRHHSRDLLSRPGIRWLNAGASRVSGTMPLTVTGADCSATFRMARDVAAASGLQQIDVPVVTLDEICRKEGRWPDIVKIDAEGIDLDVLQGATTLFGKTDVFLVECGVCAYSLPNSAAEVCSFMANHSYRLFDITHLNVSPRTGLLWLVEAVFVRETSAVWDRLGGY